MDQPSAEQALKEMEVLVGEWSQTATPAGGEPRPGEAKATFEWLEGGHLLLERSTVEMPEAPDGVCVYGCDAANGTYYQLYTDVRNVCRVYQVRIGNGEWKLWREGEPFNQRFAATISEDGNRIEGRWEYDGETAGRPTSTCATPGCARQSGLRGWAMEPGGLLRRLPRGGADAARRLPPTLRERRIHRSRRRSSRIGTATAATRTPAARGTVPSAVLRWWTTERVRARLAGTPYRGNLSNRPEAPRLVCSSPASQRRDDQHRPRRVADGLRTSTAGKRRPGVDPASFRGYRGAGTA
jgi:hypothetical protein